MSAKTTSADFGRAFEQMCNFVAVSKAGRPAETIRGLVHLCFVLFPEERFDSADQLAKSIESLLSVSLPPHEVQLALDHLIEGGVLTRPAGTNIVPEREAANALRAQIKSAHALEIRVRDAWLGEVAENYPGLPRNACWPAMTDYLMKAFRRHGIHAAALLDSSVETPQYEESLSSLLNGTVRDAFPEEKQGEARSAISGFLADVGGQPDRVEYISHLADGAFNFFSMQASPEVAEQLAAQLNELVVFLDTNFLFGILDLHFNSQVDVSRELIEVVEEHNLPFRLRYHQATERELRATLNFYGDLLRGSKWNQGFSRAAARSRNLSGIEQRYHERNAETPISVEDFLRPCEHFDVLLKEKGIDIYRTNAARIVERTDLHENYNDFLEKRGKGGKAYETIDHDVTVLDTVKMLRSNASSSLDAGALLLTCDYTLYWFDRSFARRTGERACVLLPNLFWQILRPYIPADEHFDRAFAETFALPEFRSIGSGASRACSRMLSLLTTYQDLPEGTALKMMSNDVLLDKLAASEDEEEFVEFVKESFVEENAALLKEKEALARRVADQEEAMARQGEQREVLQGHLNELSAKLEGTAAQVEGLTNATSQHKADLVRAEGKAEAVASKLDVEAAARSAAEVRAHRTSILAAALLALVLVVGGAWLLNAYPWTWLQDHERKVALLIGGGVVLVLVAFGALVSRWRKTLLLSGVGTVLLVLLGIL